MLTITVNLIYLCRLSSLDPETQYISEVCKKMQSLLLICAKKE